MHRTPFHRRCRRGAVTAQVAVGMTVLLGAAAITLDLGSMFKARGELQAVADASAISAAGMLGLYEYDDPIALARAIAVDIASRHTVAGKPVTLDPNTDIELGRGVLDPNTGKYDFVPGGELPDSVRVTVKRTVDSTDGPIDLAFARIWGRNEAEVVARATAMLVPRDISIVIDLSGSMNDDSELQHYQETEINLAEVWTSLPNNNTLEPKTDELGFTSMVEVTDNGDGTSTINVDLTSDADESTSALSHVSFGLPEGCWDQAAASATTTGQYENPEVGVDPTTGVGGVKFNATGDGLGENGVQETHSFSMTVSSEYVSQVQLTVGTKAGRNSSAVDYIVTPGPTWGHMVTWGTAVDPTGYDPTGDWGLLYLPRYQDWSGNPVVISLLQQAGYTSEEINALTSSHCDGDWYHNRVKAVLGLARWNSGKPDGFPGGNGNDYFGDSEMTELVDYPYQVGSWTDWIKNYVQSSGTTMAYAHAGFRYRYGLKTFVNYLLERRPYYAHTNVLWMTPEQPVQAVKDAVRVCCNVIEDLDSDDQVSLEIYAQTTRHEVDLTYDYQAIADHLDGMQAGHYDSWTCLGGGLQEAIDELTSERARASAKKVVLVMTDGLPNVDEHGNAGYDYSDEARAYALAKAQEAHDLGARIYCISVGSQADRQLMQQIAQIGGGEEFFAAGSIADYSAQLKAIFAELGGRRPVVLIE